MNTNEQARKRLRLIESVVGKRDTRLTGQMEFLPSPEEIRRCCELIRASWTDEDRQEHEIWNSGPRRRSAK